MRIEFRVKSVRMSAVINTGTHIFYFGLETNKLHFCLSDGNGDSDVRIKGVAITANKGNTRLAAVASGGIKVRDTCDPTQRNRLETDAHSTVPCVLRG